MLTVGTPPLSLGTSTEPFPTTDARISQSNILAPFWNDHDARDSISKVTYRTYSFSDSDNELQLFEVSKYISAQDGFSVFRGQWMLVASWNRVPPYPYRATNRGTVSEPY